jgi:Glycosyl transferase family 2
MSRVLEAAFVVAPRQNLFFVELQQALAGELERQGIRASVHTGAFPPPHPDLVYVVMPPHEYFTLMHGRVGPPADVFARTVFICAEQPTTSFFEWNLEYAPRAGALFDINRLAVRAYGAEGFHAEHLQLGYTAAWDHRDDAAERDIDVLFMGASSPRRLRHLASYSQTLRHRRCHFVISDNSRPNFAASGSYVADAEKWDLLARSKVLINLHQEETPYFEWLRVVQAVASGCAVVSETSLDVEPLRVGDHMLMGRAEALGFLAELLLIDDVRREDTARGAYAFLREQLPMAHSVGRLAEAVRTLAERPLPEPRSAFFLQPPPREEESEAALARLEPPPPVEDAAVRRTLKDLRLQVLDLSRRVDRLLRERDGGPVARAEVLARSRWWAAGRPRISVLVTTYEYAGVLGEALASLLASRERSWEVVIVDDGSRDDSSRVAAEWIARHEDVPAILVRHPFNRGLAAARNTALDFARAELCFVLDADNAIYPWCFERLLAALDADPEAAMAYGMLERFNRSGTVGLASVFPWEAARFARGNYVDAMALLRTRVLRELGGYRTDPRLYGWEDYDLWARMAERGLRAVHLPSVVARYRVSDHSMLSITNISGAEATSVIAAASPTVMSGAVLPV